MSQSLARGLDLLRLIADGTRTLDDLAASTGVHKTTILRQLATMLEAGFVARDGDHRYRLGPALYELTTGARDSSELLRVAPPLLQALSRSTDQTVHLADLQGQTARYLDKVQPPAGLHMASRIGQPTPIHSTAVGKVLLAGLPEVERRRLVATLDLAPRTPRTITDPADLLREAAEVAARGWAIDHEENEPFMNCIGAPVRGTDGSVVAAVSLSAPNVVLDRDGVVALVPELLATAAGISDALAAGA